MFLTEAVESSKYLTIQFTFLYSQSNPSRILLALPDKLQKFCNNNPPTQGMRNIYRANIALPSQCPSMKEMKLQLQTRPGWDLLGVVQSNKRGSTAAIDSFLSIALQFNRRRRMLPRGEFNRPSAVQWLINRICGNYIRVLMANWKTTFISSQKRR